MSKSGSTDFTDYTDEKVVMHWSIVERFAPAAFGLSFVGGLMCVACTGEPEDFPKAEINHALEFVNALSTGETTAAYGMLASEERESVSLEALKGDWAELVDELGAYQSVEEFTTHSSDESLGLTSVLLKCQFEEGRGVLVVVVDKTGEIHQIAMTSMEQ